MKRIRTVIAGATAAVMMSSGAFAADVNPAVMPMVEATAPAPAPSFNWNRFYVGVDGGVWWEIGPLSFDTLRAGGVAGYNMQFGRFVAGLQGSVGFYDFTSPTLEAYASLKAGVLATDNLLFYGIVGVGYDGDVGGGILNSMILGGGAEFAVSQNVSIKVEGTVWRELGTPFDYFSVVTGLNWYVGP